MTLKKFALRGMIVLAAVIALCVLFSGTFRSLTTAKVTKADVKNGKLETATVLMGKVVFLKNWLNCRKNMTKPGIRWTTGTGSTERSG